jgi:hypothetical protein
MAVEVHVLDFTVSPVLRNALSVSDLRLFGLKSEPVKRQRAGVRSSDLVGVIRVAAVAGSRRSPTGVRLDLESSLRNRPKRYSEQA